jgi:hypothetical protein
MCIGGNNPTTEIMTGNTLLNAPWCVWGNHPVCAADNELDHSLHANRPCTLHTDDVLMGQDAPPGNLQLLCVLPTGLLLLLHVTCS